MLLNFSETFKKWLSTLKDKNAYHRIMMRLRRIEHTNNLGDYKNVGENVYELRIDYGPGYRLYFSFNGNEIIILLCGGDKSTQQKDIEKAKQIINK